MLEDDHRLLRRALDGDEASFTVLYRRRQGQVYRFAFHMTGSETAAEDVTQETFLALLKTGFNFDAERGPLLAFLYGVARNQVFRLFTKQRPENGTADADEIADGNVDALEDITRRETIAEVRRAVVSLPSQYREAVVLCDLEDASYEDAAAAIGCPVGTVRSRLSRGRELLAQKLRILHASGNAAASGVLRSAR